MMEFDRWSQVLADQIRARELSATDSEELPYDVLPRPEGGYQVECCCCRKTVPMLCDLADHVPGQYYCGGSPRCCQ